MLQRVSMEKRRSAGFPADLFLLLVLPGLAIFVLLFGPQRSWIVLLFIGLFQLVTAFSVLGHSKSSVSGWLAVAGGLLVLTLGIRFALTPW